MEVIPSLQCTQSDTSDDRKNLVANALLAIKEQGVVLLKNALSRRAVQSIVDEMQPHIDATPHGLHGLSHSRRVGALVARSESSHKAIAHPVVLDICRGVLGLQQNAGYSVRITNRKRNEGEYPWRVGLTQIIDVGPGQPRQSLHRGNGLWVHDLAGAGFDPQVETMWALTDFTEDNGATHVIPGSHRWPEVHGNDDNGGARSWLNDAETAATQAVMPAGSVLLWTGWTVHGAGANQTASRRIGMNIDYSLSFLAQEENQFLACPPEHARLLTEDMRRLIGYTQGGGALNYFADCLPPKVALDENYDVASPGSHGMEVQ